MAYRCEAVSAAGLVQQIATCHFRWGFWWYVSGSIPAEKDPRNTDQKIIKQYEILCPQRYERARRERKRRGFTNLHYIRRGHFFVLLASEGQHDDGGHLDFWKEEAGNIRDARTMPLLVPLDADARMKGKKQFEKKQTPAWRGYALSYRRDHQSRTNGDGSIRWRSRVEIEANTYRRICDYYLGPPMVLAPVPRLRWQFQKRMPFEPYAPVRRQLLRLVDRMNEKRRRAGRCERIPYDALRLQRYSVPVFAEKTPFRCG